MKILNTDRITWNGQPIAVVVADTEEQAAYAASLVRVTYTTEQAVTSFEAAIAQAKTPKDVLGESPEVVHGDPDAALRSAAHAVDLTFTTPPYNHNAIEPHAAIAVWTGDDRVTVYDTSQFTAGGASSLAHVFGLKSENVTLRAPFVGGGFGGKGTLWFYNQLCVMAARLTGRPVRIALTREGVFRLVGGRTSRRGSAWRSPPMKPASSRRSSTRALPRSPTRTAFRSSSAFRRATCTRWIPTASASR